MDGKFSRKVRAGACMGLCANGIWKTLPPSRRRTRTTTENLGTMEISKRFGFEAAHLLPNLPEGHRCRRLHGHSFSVEVFVEGEVDPELGWVGDYAELDAAFAPLYEQLDHNYLNDVEGLDNPTSENLARWIWERLAPRLTGLTRVSVMETCDTRCSYTGPTPI